MIRRWFRDTLPLFRWEAAEARRYRHSWVTLLAAVWTDAVELLAWLLSWR